MPEVVLAVDGASYGGWKSVQVVQSMAQVAGTFELSVTDKHPGNAAGYAFRLGSRCTVRLDGQTVITGWVEEVRPRYSGSGRGGEHGITVSGRDATCDLVDCSHVGPPSQWRGLSLPQIAAEVCRPFGVGVANEAGLGAPIADARTNEGDTVLAFIVRLARAAGVLPVSYGDGRLTLTRAGARGAGGAVELGNNVQRAEGRQTNGQRYSRYIAKGQGQAAAPPDPKLTAQERADYLALITAPTAEAADPVVTRHRPLVVLAEGKAGPEDLLARVRWEAAVRAGRSRGASYTVSGWGPPGGGLWRINSTVQVTDAWLGLHGAMLVEGVTYDLDEGSGTTSTLTLVHPDAYKPEPKTAEIKGDFDA